MVVCESAGSRAGLRVIAAAISVVTRTNFI